MRKLIFLLGAAIALWTLPASAVLPENGLYYNPAQQGLGYYIEVQGTTLVMVSFAYDKDTGKPLFYIASGQITRAHPGASSLQDSITPAPPDYKHEYPYRFDGTFYRMSTGPCITCVVLDFNTAEHAVEAGTVHLRMADVNRITATFTLNDGSVKTVQLWRQGFGRTGYDLGRDDGRPLADMRGDWIFVDRNNPEAPVWRFNFTQVEQPQAVTDPSFRFYKRSVPKIMSFVDPDADARLRCTRYGCALEQDGEALFLVKFRDIGMDSLLGYKGDTLFIDDGTAFEYRTGDLVIGKHVINRVPDAAPPPEE